MTWTSRIRTTAVGLAFALAATLAVAPPADAKPKVDDDPTVDAPVDDTSTGGRKGNGGHWHRDPVGGHWH